jgi:hypothetical protein
MANGVTERVLKSLEEPMHSPHCEGRCCLGVDYDRYHKAIATDEYAERTSMTEFD